MKTRDFKRNTHGNDCFVKYVFHTFARFRRALAVYNGLDQHEVTGTESKKIPSSLE